LVAHDEWVPALLWPNLWPNLASIALVGAALFVALAVLHLMERAVGRFVAHRLGWRAVLVTGWIGVPVHELSHLLTAVVFRHRIVGYSLFDPDPSTGTLGYVKHAHSRPTAWQMAGYFFIGVAPLVGGAAVLSLVLSWMVPPERLWALVKRGLGEGIQDPARLLELSVLAGMGERLLRATWALLREIWHSRTSWLPLQIYLLVAVAAHLAPSRRDLSGGLRGGFVVVLVLVGGAAVAALLGKSLAPLVALVPALGLLVVATLVFELLYLALVAAWAALFGRR